MSHLSRLWQGLALAVWLLAGCSPDTTAKTPPSATAASAPRPGTQTGTPPKSHSLAIAVYNYTDRYMDSVEVNGQGAGNVDISTEYAGGGKSACCVNWTEGSKLPRRVTVKWVGGYCMQRRTNSDNETKDWRESLWKIADVEFNGPVPANPQAFEVHIYRDDHIELAMTERESLPRLKLPSPPDGYVRPGIVVNDPACAPDYDSLAAYNHPIRVDVYQGANKP